MNPRTIKAITAAIAIAAISYCAFYFNYFDTPTGDFIGNIRPPVIDYIKGNFPGKNFKFLPVFPLTLAGLVKALPAIGPDPIYTWAIVLNFVLFLQYFAVVLLLFRLFLREKAALAAMLFLCVNIYTPFTATTPELEMMLSLLIVLSLWLSIRGSKFAYIAAFLAASTKWDSVFIAPAAMFRGFFYEKKRVLAMALGTISALGAAAWLLASLVSSWGQPHPYVSEIAHRGPNVYKYLIDCVFVTSGFIPWMAMHGYQSGSLAFKAMLWLIMAPPAIIIIAGLGWGIKTAAQRLRKDFAHIFVFAGGFLAIHMIYQNTKDRYVLPILWLLVLFLFMGLSEGIAPAVKERFSRMLPGSRKKLMITAVCVCLAIYAAGIFFIISEHTLFHLGFALVFTAIAAAIAFAGERSGCLEKTAVVVAAGMIMNFMVFYGARVMNHHGKSRVEFKLVSLWYKNNAGPCDRMLISEINVPMYYTGFGSEKFMPSFFLQGSDIDSIADELKKNNVTHAFVDGFYPKRLAIKDPNAIDRRADRFVIIRENGVKSGRFRLIKTFILPDGSRSYLYKLR
jgi:hypothetical protein